MDGEEWSHWAGLYELEGEERNQKSGSQSPARPAIRRSFPKRGRRIRYG